VRNLSTGQVIHAELLLRLRHRGVVLPPEAFLSIAEEHGQIEMVDARVLREAIALLEAHHPEPLRLEVNVSGQSLRDPRFTTQLGAQLAYRGVSPRNLVLAMPEHVALEEPMAAFAFARRVRSLGCMVALDHFGNATAAGDRSSAERLLRGLPLDYVKLTRTIVAPLAVSGQARETLRELLALTRAEGVETVAVFVGDDETLGLLERERVGYAQGFFIGTPAPVAVSLETITADAAQHSVPLAA
jgi:EAL domain-containing protein (putative c-di-GMP-specific phosphodiesterase class I)